MTSVPSMISPTFVGGTSSSAAYVARIPGSSLMHAKMHPT